jgi:hypothetical protein
MIQDARVDNMKAAQNGIKMMMKYFTW